MTTTSFLRRQVNYLICPDAGQTATVKRVGLAPALLTVTESSHFQPTISADYEITNGYARIVNINDLANPSETRVYDSSGKRLLKRILVEGGVTYTKTYTLNSSGNASAITAWIVE